ncbi:MAG: inositol monophosphatase family protein [Acidobacteriota bacterium]
MEHNLAELLDLAGRAAALAACVHRQMRSERLTVSTKNHAADLVTEVDRESERQLVAAIRRERPDDAILGEEGTDISGSSGVRWILDPLDGTTNFIYGYLGHAVAVGVEIDGTRALGVVHDTSRNQVYSGVIGTGANVDGEPLKIRTETALGQALFATGFLPDSITRSLQGEILTRLLPRIRDVRRSGCPALDFCAVAAGKLDGYFETGLGRWDIAAGAAIAEAAGALVVELEVAGLPNPFLVVANETLANALIEELIKAGLQINQVTGWHK